MNVKESNFVSAVVYLNQASAQVLPFLQRVGNFLNDKFKKYEIICVDDGCDKATIQQVKEYSKSQRAAITIIHMGLSQGLECAMNAGLDCAIGDFVYEFDVVDLSWPQEMLEKAYLMALSENKDIVSAAPVGGKSKLTSRLFYDFFNRCTPKGIHALRSEAFRLLSRRAINQVHAISNHLPYRKAAYAFSGLAYGVLEYQGSSVESVQRRRFGQAVDSLVLYTDMGYRVSLAIAGAMLLLTFAELVYTLAIYIGGRPVSGWTTTMLVMTGSFFGLFCILTIVIKYLALLTDLLFKQKRYLVESVEKLPTGSFAEDK